MQTMKQTKGFSPAHTATIHAWCQMYPYRKSIGIATIRANPEENMKLQSMLAEGHTERDIYAKGYYHRMNVICDVPKKKSLMGPKPVKPRSGGQYPCYLCSHVSASKAHHSAHVRWEHPGESRTAKLRNQGKATLNSVHIVTGAAPLVVAPGTVTAHVPPALVGQLIIVDIYGNVKAAKTLNHCPECGYDKIKEHIAVANL